MHQTVSRTKPEQPIIAGRLGPLRGDVREPAFQAFLLLWAGFTVAPILFGLDKFFHILVDWDRYLAPFIVRQTPWSAHQLMYALRNHSLVQSVHVQNSLVPQQPLTVAADHGVHELAESITVKRTF